MACTLALLVLALGWWLLGPDETSARRPPARVVGAPAGTPAPSRPLAPSLGDVSPEASSTPEAAPGATADLPAVPPGDRDETGVGDVGSAGLRTPYGRVVRVRGAVVDTRGRPCAGADVELRGGQLDRDPPGDACEGPVVAAGIAEVLERMAGPKVIAGLGRVRAGLDGAFDVVLPPGRLGQLDTLVVTAQAPDDDLSVACARVSPVTRYADGVLDLGDLVLLPVGHLDVFVREAGGPVANVEVLLSGRVRVQGEVRSVSDVGFEVEARTDASGCASFLLTGYQLQLELSAPGRARALCVLGAPRGRKRVEVALVPGVELRGVVRDAAGAPLANVRVWAQPLVGGFAVSGATTDGEGRFVLTGLAARVACDVVATDDSGAHASATTRVTAPADLELALEAAGAVLVTLAPAGPDVVSDADLDLLELDVEREGPAGRWERTTWQVVDPSRQDDVAPGRSLGRNQRLVLGLAPGACRVRAKVSGAFCPWVEVQVRAGEEGRVELRLARGRRLCGRVVDAAGAPAATQVVTIRFDVDAVSYASSLFTDEEGGFALEDLPPALAEVELVRSGFQPRRLRVTDEEDLGPVMLEPDAAGPR